MPPLLGLRYSIVRQTAEKEANEVDGGALFHSGGKFRLRVEANDTGYLYLIERVSSYHWTLLFPTATIAGGDNLVQKAREYKLPPGYWFELDSRRGKAAEVSEEIVAGVRARVQPRDLVLQKVEHTAYMVNRNGIRHPPGLGYYRAPRMSRDVRLGSRAMAGELETCAIVCNVS